MENESLIPKVTSSGIFFVLGSLTLVILALIYFGDILKPLVIAFLIWFIINQLKVSLRKIKIKGKPLPSMARSILAFVIIFLVVFIVVELLIKNIEGIVESMPGYVANFHENYGRLSDLVNNPKIADNLQGWVSKLDLASMATSLLSSLSGIVANSAVILVYVIFLLMEDASHKIKIDKLFPVKKKQYSKFVRNMNSISDSIRYYMTSMTGISLFTGVVSYVILLVMGVEYAFLWAFLIFILNFIPYLGPLVSSLLPAIFAVVTSSHLMQFVYVFAAMEGVQILIGNFIQPMVQGKGTNLAPMTIVVALAFWGGLWGIVGMILAIPIMAVMVIICSQIPSTRFIAVLLSEKGEIPNLD